MNEIVHHDLQDVRPHCRGGEDQRCQQELAHCVNTMPVAGCRLPVGSWQLAVAGHKADWQPATDNKKAATRPPLRNYLSDDLLSVKTSELALDVGLFPLGFAIALL